MKLLTTALGIMAVSALLASCQEKDCNEDLGYHKAGGSRFNPKCVLESDDADSRVGDAAVDARAEAGAIDGTVDGSISDAGSTDGEVVPCDASATWFADDDGDGFGDPAETTTSCSKPDGYVANDDDLYPSCGRAKAPADCVIGSLQCAEGTVGDRETCVEDSAFPGCTDWTASASCDASAPVCDGAGLCGKCGRDSDCTEFDQVCNTTTGACVQCTPATEVAQCPDMDPSPGDQGAACDPVAKTCTGQPRGSVSGCEACVSDSECIGEPNNPPHKCVPINFGGAKHGSYCLQVAPSATCPNTAASKREATSVLGLDDEYCFPNTALTTCEAILDFKTGGAAANGQCTSNDQCGAAGIADGKCVNMVCTYFCDSHRDCSGDNNCIGTLGAKYCDPS